MKFLASNYGIILVWLGVACAALFPGLGSAKGVGIVGRAGAGLLTEKPELFGKVLVLEILPGTQGLYGLLIGIIIMNRSGVMGAAAAPMDAIHGLQYFLAALPIAAVGYFSAIHQAKTAAAGVGILAKHPDRNGNAITLAAIVEMYAILAFLVSLLVVINIK